MAIECNIAPFINIEFYLTGAWGEQRATHKHAGIDISTGKKSNVYNMFDGTVISVTHSGYGGEYGPNIIIQEDSGRTWLYGDLEKFSNWSVGDRINKGDLISQEGNPTGTGSTGNHVHVELEMLSKGQPFKYGYNNSSNPCPILGIENVVNQTAYIYNGSIPPEPPGPEPTPGRRKKRKFPWAVYTKIIRNRRTFF